MRTYLLATAALLLAAAPAGAASRPSSQGGLRDASGDWQVASQDIVSAQVSSGRGTLRAVLTLADAPDEVAEYALTLNGDCEYWSLVARGTEASLQHTTCDPAVTLPDKAPATVTVSGKQVVITAPYALGLAKGMRFESLSSSAASFLTGVGFGSSLGPSAFVMTGDVAWGNVNLALG